MTAPDAHPAGGPRPDLHPGGLRPDLHPTGGLRPDLHAAGGLRALLRAALDDVADAVLPPLCALCGAPEAGDGLGCAAHRLQLAPPVSSSAPRCGRCAARLPPAIRDGARCAACRERAPGFARVLALGDYADPALREWVLAFKYGRPWLARRLGRALGVRLVQALDRAAAAAPAEQRRARGASTLAGSVVLVPVPLHRWRRLERGYDQALELAREAAAAGGFALVRALVRARATAPQGAPDAPSRAANVAGAFRARRHAGRLARRLAGRSVWLVDDVVTSGATAAACARELRRLGAARVSVLCLARAAPLPADATGGVHSPG